VAVGYRALYGSSGANGFFNSALGTQSLFSNTSGAYNTAVGYQSLTSNTTASSNTAVGYQAGYTNITGTQCTYLGAFAGQTTTGTFNTFVGYGAGYLITSGTKNTVLGQFSGNAGGLDIRTADNYIVLSDGDGNPRLYMNGSGFLFSVPTYNNTTGSGANLFVSSTGEFIRSTSSLKYKRDVQTATHGLEKVMQLRSVTYKGKSEADGDKVFGGLIAEEVHDAGLTQFVQYAEDGTPDALSYGHMVSLAFKAIQEQQAIIESLKARLDAANL
jgi:hypothetical protein